MTAYIGTEPVPKASLLIAQDSLTVASNTINISEGYPVNSIRVYINGGYIQPSTYTATDGLNIVFGETLPIGTEYIVESIDNFEVANTPSLNGGAQANFIAMPQVGGDPIIESGSNADGEWVRSADGTQWAKTLTITDPSSAVFAAQGNGYTTNENLIWTFPLAFTAVPGLAGTTTSPNTWVDSSGSTTGTQGAFRQFTFFAGLSGSSPALTGYYLAIGRWK